ncbi:SDR family NAD(P)-dependent oxidoreductase [Arthrobacter nitrophenolicus]|uniref:SDR family NAD(P)-dependent oxidoreductase n=1 Tax=Arthrobacter nitrophenolicus TaxID=683150 RepID=A0A4R5XLR3_9MICC|nr:SDR family NAD(P)-dependent oxidoreductase [Arthrobacter nitrophenolicus]TDL32289.1 SDR family NAD(P)-dependent oxidoreductase [Arthrobacter nitrophenolicus]
MRLFSLPKPGRSGTGRPPWPDGLRGKVVLITGGAGGIAAATAQRLAAAGARVSLVDRDQAAVEQFVSQLGPRHLAIAADVSVYASLQAATGRTVEHFGRLDIVFACAGVGSASTVAASSTEDLLRIVDINLGGVIRTVKATLDEVTSNRGYYLLMSSAAALKNVPRANAYAASKAGVEAFGGALRLELAHKGVDVGVAHPAWVRTGMISGPDTRAGESASLPWPFRVVSSTGTCADLLVGAMAARRRKVFVPRSLALMEPLRWLSTGPLWDAFMRPRAALSVARLESASPNE